ncbi:MAG: rhomboid family intramembrane serine protease [Gammaproteobacteria bacterium]|nr:rhomboid family intramembrane serine protease [Gammaproteobacteria bacterium]
MQWFSAVKAPLDEDLRPFSRYLSEHGVFHRIVERGGRQVVLVAEQGDVSAVRRRFEQWQVGDLELAAAAPDASPLRWPDRRRVFAVVGRYPVVILLALLSIAGAWLVWTRNVFLVHLLSFEDLAIAVGGQWWRFVTPAFLHFGAIHLVFNLLWLADLGRRVESSQSSARLLLIAAVTALCANVSQYWHAPGSLFGGMSGVVYGLLGYCWLAGRSRPASPLHLPPGVVAFLLVWMALGMTGVFSLIGIHIANAAHLGGFLSGLLLACLPPPRTRPGDTA